MVTRSTQAWLDTLELDEAGQVRADIALALAGSLDAANRAASAGALQSVAGIARELRDALTEIAEMQGEADAFVGDLFAQ